MVGKFALNQISWMFSRLLLIIVLIGSVSSLGWSKQNNQIEVEFRFGLQVLNYLDGKIEVTNQATTFGCIDRIWGGFEIRNLPSGLNELSTYWYSPSEEVTRSRTIRKNVRDSNLPFYLSSFIEVESGASLMSFLDPGAGYEKYIGEWRVEVRRNSQVIGRGEFEMLC